MARKITVQTSVVAPTEQGWTSRWRYLQKGTKSVKLSISRSGILSKLLPSQFFGEKSILQLCAKEILYTENVSGSAGSLQADEMQEEKNQIDAEIMKYGSS